MWLLSSCFLSSTHLSCPVLLLSGRYLFLNAIANQLRYPNSHTHYFSCTMLYLFAEANAEAIQEQITRYFLPPSSSVQAECFNLDKKAFMN